MSEKLTARLDKVHIMTDRKSAQFDSYELETIRHAVGNARNRIATLKRDLAISNKVLELALDRVKGCPWTANVKFKCASFISGNPCIDRLGETGKNCWREYFTKQATAEITEATDE